MTLTRYLALVGVVSGTTIELKKATKKAFVESSSKDPDAVALSMKEFNRLFNNKDYDENPGENSGFLASKDDEKKGQKDLLLLQEKAKAMHATQYYGDIQVGDQTFSVIFDSGSGHLLIPGEKCDSAACKEKDRNVYHMKKMNGIAIKKSNDDSNVEKSDHDSNDSKKSDEKSGESEKSDHNDESGDYPMAIGWADEPTTPVDEDSSDRDVTSISFASGEVVGNFYRDKVCLSSELCGVADFIAMTEESDNPFKGSVWDGVLGLGLDLTDSVPEFAVVTQIFNQNQNNKKEKGRKDSDNKQREESSPSIFSYFLHDYGGDIRFGKDAVYERIKENAHISRVNVSVDGYWQFAIEDITINGKRTGLCSNYTGGVCQGVVDTGSSLIMAPTNLLGQITTKLQIDDKCKKKNLPSLGFIIKDSKNEVNLELEADEYLDRSDTECYISMMSIGDTGRGPLIVLGYPFLRNYYTMFDFENKQLGFVHSKEGLIIERDLLSSQMSSVEMKDSSKTNKNNKKNGITDEKDGIILKGIRPMA